MKFKASRDACVICFGFLHSMDLYVSVSYRHIKAEAFRFACISYRKISRLILKPSKVVILLLFLILFVFSFS